MLKVDEMIEKYQRTKNANIPEDFESLLIKEEKSIRKYIAVNNRLTLENNNLRDQIRLFKEDKQKFKEQMNKTKEEYENKIKEMIKEISNLNIIKTELENAEKKYLKKLEIKQKEIYNLKIKLNNLIKISLKNKEGNKDDKILLEKNFKKNNSTDFGVKLRINYSDLDLLQKNSKINSSTIIPQSSRYINDINCIFDFKISNNIFPERNYFFNNINKVNKINTRLFKNENNVVNDFLINNNNYKSLDIKENNPSVLRKIRNNLRSTDDIKYNLLNDIKYEIKELKNKENKTILVSRRNSNKIKRTLSSINNKNYRNDASFDLFKNDNLSLNLKNPTQNKKLNGSFIPDITSGKKGIKVVNKFRISSVNKEELNLNKQNFNKQMILISINYNIPTN